MASTPSARHLLFRHPAQLIVVGFGTVLAIGTILLMLPISTEGDGSASLVTAVFTATSALCVTGLSVVDTPTYWSGFGEGVILTLIQLGGLGIMAVAALLGLMFSHRLSLRWRLSAAQETKSMTLGDVRSLLLGVIAMTLLFEAVIAAILTTRFLTAYDYSFGRAVYHGVFHAISGFNNAGFALYSDNLVGFVGDWWICLPIALGIIAGGLGFPVLIELRKQISRPKLWSLHTKLTLAMTALLLGGAIIFVLLAEWNNPRTLGSLDVGTRILAGFFQAVQPRTAGFNSVDIAGMHDSTLFGFDLLMFIGGGSAGTSGGIKVTTFAILFFVMLAEVRGEKSVVVFRRRISERVQRQALTVTLVAILAVMISTMAVMWISGQRLSVVLFEVVSALGTTGLSTGITPGLPDPAKVIIVLMMFIGRVGPITMVTALALRDKPRKYEYPEERPIIG